MRHIKGGQDEFYTNDVLATHLVHITVNEIPDIGMFIEPSAGDGAFVKPILNLGYSLVAYDINPKHPFIIKADFMEQSFEKFEFKTVSIGNPPFGFASNNAIKFFNKCAEFSDYVAFIVPRTFRKISVHNKLNKHFHLLKEYPVPKNAFLLDGKPHDVPCVFQIWERKDELRPTKAGNLGKYLKIVKPRDADFAMRRVGGRAGQILEGLDHSESSTYFFKEMQEGVLEKLKAMDFEVRDDTVGVRSLSQLEIFEYLEDVC